MQKKKDYIRATILLFLNKTWICIFLLMEKYMKHNINAAQQMKSYSAFSNLWRYGIGGSLKHYFH